MADWTVEADCLTDWIDNWDIAFNYQDTILQDRADVQAFFPYIDDEYIKGAFGAVCDGLFHIVRCFKAILNKDTDFTPVYNAIYYVVNHAGGEVEAITWKDIIKAFGDATDPGKMWIVTELDWMRKQLWHKPTQIKWQENPFED